jgi:hypothetical protein
MKHRLELIEDKILMRIFEPQERVGEGERDKINEDEIGRACSTNGE